jgi:mercuric reductase
MIERGTVGGTCVNTGCVPSKALLAAAAARHGAASQPFPGIATQAGPVDMAALAGSKDDLAAGMRASKYVDLAADYGWPIIAGTARFACGPDAPLLQVRLNDTGAMTVEAGQYLVATGAAPWIPPIGGLDRAGYLTSTMAMELTELPESLLVIGGNAVGLELAQLFARLGSRVTIAEALDRLAPFDEPEVSAVIEEVFDDEGIGILTAAAIASVRGDATGRSVEIKTAGGPERELAYGQILVAAGRHPVPRDGCAADRAVGPAGRRRRGAGCLGRGRAVRRRRRARRERDRGRRLPVLRHPHSAPGRAGRPARRVRDVRHRRPRPAAHGRPGRPHHLRRPARRHPRQGDGA